MPLFFAIKLNSLNDEGPDQFVHYDVCNDRVESSHIILKMIDKWKRL